ncbi:hypothetical protein B0H10DRAFT_2163138 [Mycena sp. CBHHK59/15]|nr:hypothetical protein B0H10DRAFT_2163138 [Mycena sp. CBHHK59/15]
MAFRASAIRTNRAIVYARTGDPSQVLGALTFPALPSPPPNTLNIKFLLSPINPADVNVIQGVYPAKPALTQLVESGTGSKEQPVFIGGNEGLAEVTHVGTGISSLSAGDWVVMTKSQSGTWSSSKNVGEQDVLKLPRGEGLTEVHGATMTVNPPTAYNMLHDFVNLEKDDWLVQNGANSAVGQAVIQIADARGLKTLNLVRKRQDLDHVTKRLEYLGATKVLTYDDLADRTLTETVKEWTAGKGIQLGLNCVSGKDTTSMARLLGKDAYLNLTATGFWQSRWYSTHTRQDKENLMHTLVDLVTQGKLKEPEHEILTISAKDTDEIAGQKIRDIISKMSLGQYGRKVLLRIE